MKHWIRYILTLFLFLAVLPPASASAASALASLKADGNNVTITLEIPNGQEDNITTLRFHMSASITAGSAQPVFKFSDGIASEVKDAEITPKDNGKYFIDIILSGKTDQRIFKNSSSAEIGTLSFSDASKDFQAMVEIAAENDQAYEQPMVHYVDSSASSVLSIPLAASAAVNLPAAEKEPETEQPDNNPGAPSAPGASSPSVPDLPPETPPSSTENQDEKEPDNDEKQEQETPDIPGNSDTSVIPGNQDNSSASDSQEENAANDNASKQEFNKTKKEKLTCSIKNGSKKISFKWKKIDDADGYIIYLYNKKTDKYEKFKTISNPRKTSCTITGEYASTYSFKIRAYKTGDDGGKTYGKFSAAITVTTSPAKVSQLKASRQNSKKVTLSWKKVKKADGYQIFCSTKKNGTYACIKTIKKRVSKVTINQKGKKTYYYKVRAFIKADGKKITGKYSNKSSI